MVEQPKPTRPETVTEGLHWRWGSWILGGKAETIRDRTVAGGKYLHLCRFANHFYEAFGNTLRIIPVDRPIDAQIRSLQHRRRRHLAWHPDGWLWPSPPNEPIEVVVPPRVRI